MVLSGLLLGRVYVKKMWPNTLPVSQMIYIFVSKCLNRVYTKKIPLQSHISISNGVQAVNFSVYTLPEDFCRSYISQSVAGGVQTVNFSAYTLPEDFCRSYISQSVAGGVQTVNFSVYTLPGDFCRSYISQSVTGGVQAVNFSACIPPGMYC